jgi:hypothetical protein
MTIAIGAPFQYDTMKCALVCADSRIVWSDGSTAWGSKLHLSIGFQEGKAFSCSAIATASEDAQAALMLAKNITSALADNTITDTLLAENALKAMMTEWHSAMVTDRPLRQSLFSEWPSAESVNFSFVLRQTQYCENGSRSQRAAEVVR